MKLHEALQYLVVTICGQPCVGIAAGCTPRDRLRQAGIQKDIANLHNPQGAGIAQWLERRIRD